MKLFILFTLFVCILAEEYKLPDYTATETFIANCKEHTEDKTKCKTCHAGFSKNIDSTKCERITTDIQNPAYVDTNNNIIHPEIGYDFTNGTCQKTIKIVAANGETETTDKYSGAKSCLTCAQYKADGTGCAICATGYLENNGGCTPLSINPFPNNDEITNKNCIYGAYDSGNPKCYACKDPYIVKDNKCIFPTGVTDADTVVEGCLKMSFSKNNAGDVYSYKCVTCHEGYTLHNGVCFKSTYSPEYCQIVDSKKNCLSCIPGYHLSGSQCSKCTIKMAPDAYFTGDECNVYPTSACDCNPNCIRDTKSYATCVSRHCDLFSETEMSTKNKKNPKCLRCQQGYQLNTDNECEPCKTEGCFADTSKTTCVAGYYLAKETGTDNKTCVKCEGKCTDCISKDICVDQDSLHVDYKVALNGLPCFDPNCLSCSTEDSSICYECIDDTNYKLIGGKCYSISVVDSFINDGSLKRMCQSYRNPVSENDKLYYTFASEAGYEREYNKNGEQYYCKHYNYLPHYYKIKNGNELECAGKNRDPRRDCECTPGYFATNIDKSTDCEKSYFEHCEIPVSNETCLKCNYSMILINDGVQKFPELRCGCPRENMRINANGICVDCPEECATCETILNSQGEFVDVNCTKCRGEVEYGDKSGLAERNYNRNLTNQCQCNSGYKSHNNTLDAETGSLIVYSCYEIPSNCLNEDSHVAEEYEVKCTKCDKTGFTVFSSCTQCENAHYPTYSADQETISKCTPCPSADGSVDGTTYCDSCTKDGCTICIDSNMNVTDNCRTCNEGYSMIFINETIEGTDIITKKPYCLKCPNYCDMTMGGLCYLVTDISKNEDFKTQYQNKIPYQEGILSANPTVVCEACFDGAVPTENCKCGTEKYQDHHGRCHECVSVVGESTFTAVDKDGQVLSTKHKFSEVCNFNKNSLPLDGSIGSVCQANVLSPYYPECTVCKDTGRDPTFNCTRCKDINTFAVFDGTNHICQQCDAKCTTCENVNTCKTCKAKYATGANCEQCIKGYYVKDLSEVGKSAKCEKCPHGCAECESATKCTACSSENNVVGKNNDCKECVDGYYFDYKLGECKEVDVSKGYAESKPICLKSDGTEVKCEGAAEGDIASVIEIPVKCDTSKGVGISPYPVNRTCVCDQGFLDIRNKTDIEADPVPQCTSVVVLTRDDFCVDGEFDANGNVKCTKCNADYLELKEGKCVCKNTHYTTSWGSCVPCGRHMKGCTKCSGKYMCDECDSSAYKLGEEKEENGEKRRECVGK